MSTLVFQDLSNGGTRVVQARRLLIAGFTGRDEQLVAAHVAELAAEGVPVPESTPTLYELDPSLVRQTAALAVAGSNTSGEVEPVLVVSDGRRLLTVGSDHTDRDVERRDIADSKAACGKVVGTTCVDADDVADWDGIGLSSRVDDGVVYQNGRVDALLPPSEILAHLGANGIELTEGDVLFLGTLPAQGGIRASRRFEAALQVPDGPTLELSYRVVDLSSTGRSPLAKPELEFTAVQEVGWTPVEGVAGQSERILAADTHTGVGTRMLRFEPGTDTSALGVLRHDFWEEVYILSGELHDLTLDQIFGAGTYACRPPGMPHGPWRSEPGCVTFEVRYPAL